MGGEAELLARVSARECTWVKFQIHLQVHPMNTFVQLITIGPPDEDVILCSHFSDFRYGEIFLNPARDRIRTGRVLTNYDFVGQLRLRKPTEAELNGTNQR